MACGIWIYISNFKTELHESESYKRIRGDCIYGITSNKEGHYLATDSYAYHTNCSIAHLLTGNSFCHSWHLYSSMASRLLNFQRMKMITMILNLQGNSRRITVNGCLLSIDAWNMNFARATTVTAHTIERNQMGWLNTSTYLTWRLIRNVIEYIAGLYGRGMVIWAVMCSMELMTVCNSWLSGIFLEAGKGNVVNSWQEITRNNYSLFC